MAIDPKSFDSPSLLEYLEKALEAMGPDLSEKDWGIVGSLRKLASYHDETSLRVQALEMDATVEPKDRIRAMELHNKAIYTLPQVIAGLDKLGGSVAARKALGEKPAAKTGGLQALRGGRAG